VVAGAVAVAVVAVAVVAVAVAVAVVAVAVAVVVGEGEVVVPEQGQEQLLAAALPVVAALILVPVHTVGLTRTGSARKRIGFEGAIGLGLPAAGLLTALLVPGARSFSNHWFTTKRCSSNARPSPVGMCGTTRRSCAISIGLTRFSG
jgi:hypothetical protein